MDNSMALLGRKQLVEAGVYEYEGEEEALYFFAHDCQAKLLLSASGYAHVEAGFAVESSTGLGDSYHSIRTVDLREIHSRGAFFNNITGKVMSKYPIIWSRVSTEAGAMALG